MRLIPDKYGGRQPIATDFGTTVGGDPDLPLDIRYKGDAGVMAAIALDGHIIPAIIKAVNNHDALVAALVSAVKWSDANAYRGAEMPWQLACREAIAQLKET